MKLSQEFIDLLEESFIDIDLQDVQNHVQQECKQLGRPYEIGDRVECPTLNHKLGTVVATNGQFEGMTFSDPIIVHFNISHPRLWSFAFDSELLRPIKGGRAVGITRNFTQY